MHSLPYSYHDAHSVDAGILAMEELGVGLYALRCIHMLQFTTGISKDPEVMFNSP